MKYTLHVPVTLKSIEQYGFQSPIIWYFTSSMVTLIVRMTKYKLHWKTKNDNYKLDIKILIITYSIRKAVIFVKVIEVIVINPRHASWPNNWNSNICFHICLATNHHTVPIFTDISNTTVLHHLITSSLKMGFMFLEKFTLKYITPPKPLSMTQKMGH